MIFEQIKTDLITAMKAKEQDKVMALRSILTAMKNELVAGEKKETLSDEESLGILKRLAKQRKESITQFREGGREDLIANEEKDLEIITAYLPPELDDEAIKSLVLEAKEETGAETKADMGRLMGAAMQKVAGQADGTRVKAIVESVLS